MEAGQFSGQGRSSEQQRDVMKKIAPFFSAVLIFCGSFFGPLPAGAAEPGRESGAEADSSELQMIADRMAALTGSLKEMPHIPKLDATLVFPERRGDSGETSSEDGAQNGGVSPEKGESRV